MPGLTDLQTVLDSIVVECDEVTYGFATQPVLPDAPLVKFEAQIREKEGTTIIAATEHLESAGIKYEGPFAKLTVNVHTSLDLIGLTAVLATKLAENDISANVVAGFFHDHIYVQFDKRQEAIDSIAGLKESIN